MAIAESHGLPVGLCIEGASPHEVKLVDYTLVEMVIPEAPQNLVGDNAYDSDKLDAELICRMAGLMTSPETAPLIAAYLTTWESVRNSTKARRCPVLPVDGQERHGTQEPSESCAE